MDRGERIQPLTGKAAVVDLVGQCLFRKLSVAPLRPSLPPCLQPFGRSPIGGGDSIEQGVSCFVGQSVPVFVQAVDPLLLFTPGAVRLHGADGA